MQHQDWDPVVIGKKKAVKPKNAEQAAMSGAMLFLKKGAPNKQSGGTVIDARRLDDEDVKLPHVSTDLKLQISQARQSKGLTQKEFAASINERVTLVADYEAGRGIPDQKVLSKMSRALGVQLKK